MPFRSLAWVCLTSLALAPNAPAGERPKYALIVANNESRNPKLAPLRFADDDGALYYELFSAQAREVVLLSVLDADTQQRHPGLAERTRPPTRRNLEASLAALNARMLDDRAAGNEPILYFLFSGHGQRSPEGDGQITLLDGLFSRSELFGRVLRPSAASYIHLIIDACDSYYFVNSRRSLPAGPSYAQVVQRFLDDRTLAEYPHVGVLLSTDKQQESHEWAAIGAGVFSHQIRSALLGAADVNADGKVEYSEVSAFVAAANLRVGNPRGRIEMYARPPASNRSLPLSDLTQPSQLSYLLLPAEQTGRVWIEDERGVRAAELNKEPERPVLVALPQQRTYYVRSDLGESRVRPTAPGQLLDAAALRWRNARVARRGALEEALHTHLFAVPFGPRFYSGYIASTGEHPVAPAQGPDLSP